MHSDIRVQPSKKKLNSVPRHVIKDILPKKQSVTGISSIIIQLKNRTVIDARYFPNTISIGFNGSENNNLSVFCLYSSEKLFIVSSGTEIRNKKPRLYIIYSKFGF